MKSMVVTLLGRRAVNNASHIIKYSKESVLETAVDKHSTVFSLEKGPVIWLGPQ